MAYNRKEERTVIGELTANKNDERIVVAKIKDVSSGVEKVDVRYWYEEDGVQKPGKGIRMFCEEVPEVIALLISGLNTDERFDFEEACRKYNLDIEVSDAE